MTVTTPRKRAANRANAAKSTGPRTPEGKRRAGRNAVTHGLFSRAAVLPGEDVAELERLRRGMMARLRPRDELERMLADRAVSEAWRLRRAVAFEARVIASKTAEEQFERRHYTARYADKPPLHAGQIIRGLLSADVLTKLSRYEQRIERSMYRAMAELRRLQGEPLPEGEWLDTEADDEPAGAPDDGDPMRKTKPRRENSENVEPPVEEDEEEEDYEDEEEGTDEEEDERARRTKPRTENSQNVEPPVEEDEEEEDYEDEEEDDRPAARRRTRKTKPRRENSENDDPPAEEDEEEEDYEDEEEDEDDGGPSATEGDALPRETKPNAENSGFFPAVPRPEPEAPAPAPQARAVFIKQTRDRIYGRRRR